MPVFDKDFNGKCEEYLNYLYTTASIKYSDADDMDSLVQDTMIAFIVQYKNGKSIQHPKGFLSSILNHKYNDMLRKKYSSHIVSYDISENIPQKAP